MAPNFFIITKFTNKNDTTYEFLKWFYRPRGEQEGESWGLSTHLKAYENLSDGGMYAIYEEEEWNGYQC